MGVGMKVLLKWGAVLSFLIFTFCLVKTIRSGAEEGDSQQRGNFASTGWSDTSSEDGWRGRFSKNLIPSVPMRKLKDPFLPSGFESGARRQRMRRNPLQGIAVKENHPYAVIGGRQVRIGNRIFGMRVLMIRNNKVILAGRDKIRVYYLF